MHSPALFSAALLFTASGFSNALPADSSADGPAAGCKKYHVKQGETCDLIAQKSQSHQSPFTQSDTAFTTQDFLAWNPSINKACTDMLADHDYCVSNPGSTGGKKDKGGKKSGSKPKHPDGHDGDQKQGASTNACFRWSKAVQGDTCYTIARKANIQWGDLLEWNPDLKPKRQGQVCADPVPGKDYCVARPAAYRAVGFYHPTCSGAVHNDVAVPPGSTIDDGVCINTECKVGSLYIPDNLPGIVGCPKYNVQISYFESTDCGGVVNGVGSGGHWFGYDYASIGECHRLQDDGWQVQSLHLRCAPQWDDCIHHQRCSVDTPPASGICHRGSNLAFGQ